MHIIRFSTQDVNQQRQTKQKGKAEARSNELGSKDWGNMHIGNNAGMLDAEVLR